MTNWQWLALGAVAGYLVARSGSTVGGGFNLSAGFGGGARVPGSGATPLDQPTGSEPYRAVGAYNPQLPGSGFPDLIDLRDNARLVNGNPVS